MKWYNKYIFRHFGDRRLMTRPEFLQQIRAEVNIRELRVLPAREHELLMDIAATAHVIVQDQMKTGSVDGLVWARLQSALTSYRIVEDDRLNQNTPHSTNAREELHLMDIPQ